MILPWFYFQINGVKAVMVKGRVVLRYNDPSLILLSDQWCQGGHGEGESSLALQWSFQDRKGGVATHVDINKI